MKAAKVGVEDLIFGFVNMLHMLLYVHQGVGVGGRITLPLLTCCTCRRIFIRGCRECINVPDEYFAYVTEPIAIVGMLHMLSYIYQGVGGCINVPDEL